MKKARYTQQGGFIVLPRNRSEQKMIEVAKSYCDEHGLLFIFSQDFGNENLYTVEDPSKGGYFSNSEQVFEPYFLGALVKYINTYCS